MTLATASKNDVTPLTDAQRHQVREVLDAVLNSAVFHSAHRGCRFLEYIVDQALADMGHQLKERTIGVEVFDRPPQYSTGDDAVVRVQAGDIRKRLQRFYSLPESESLTVEIVLPLGTYCPEFRFRQRAESKIVQPLRVEARDSGLVLPQLPETTLLAVAPPQDKVTTAIPEGAAPLPRQRLLSKRFLGIAACLILAVAGWGGWRLFHAHEAQSPSDKFWAPLLTEHQPVLVCLAKSVTYHPSEGLFAGYEKTHPGEFGLEWQRMGVPLPLPPGTPMHWGDLKIWTDYGVASGDVYAAQELAVAFSRMQKENHLRIGQDYGYADLRQDPSVLVGAFNNRWTMELSANMPFRFVETPSSLAIAEVGGAKRRWMMESIDSRKSVDYAIVARLLNGGTGNFVLIVGGLGSSGTQAATELVTDPAYLNSALQTLPSNWPKHNIAYVLSTTVTETVAGPPTIVASSVW